MRKFMFLKHKFPLKFLNRIYNSIDLFAGTCYNHIRIKPTFITEIARIIYES